MKKLSIFFLSVALSSCCTLVNGKYSDINVKSNVPNADVYLNGAHKGTTPLVIEAKRTSGHVLTVKKDGYMPYQAQLSPTVSGWIFGNILFGGIPGLVIDFCSGSWSTIEPSDISAHMQPEQKAKKK